MDMDRAIPVKAPATPAERELVLTELDSILSSSHFRSSKRYPALLKYVVERTLDGDSAELKERVLGVVVFERQPDYDTTADPVVRVSAGEIRKRIAQYYHERGEEPAVQISLPLGSYVPEFKFHDAPREANQIATAEPLQAMQPAAESGAEAIIAVPPVVSKPISSPTRLRQLRYSLIAACAVLLLSAIGLIALHNSRGRKQSDGLWGPTLQAPGIVLIVVGNGHPELTTPPPPQTSLIDYMLGPYNHISLSSAIAISSITGALQKRGRSYEIKDDTSTSLQDLQARPIVLIGAMNNRWTERLTQSLRYRLASAPVPHIEDSQHPDNLAWSLDNSQPYTSISTDYAILVRCHDQTTNGPILVAAGLGPWANEAASQFASSPRGLEKLDNKLPPGWSSKNIEVVLKTDVIEQEPGPTSVVAVHVW